MTLAELPIGSRAKVTGVRPGSDAVHRLMEMGLVAGTNVEVKQVAPFGDPMQLELRGYQLSIRGREAESFLVELL